MQFTLLRKEPLSDCFERWFFQLSPSDFTAFGYFIESLDGVGLHHRSKAADNVMEVDVALGFATELEYLLSVF